MDETWYLNVYNKTTSRSVLKLLSHENKGAKVEVGFVIQIETGRISEQRPGCDPLSLFLLGVRVNGCSPSRYVPSRSAYTKSNKKTVKVLSKVSKEMQF